MKVILIICSTYFLASFGFASPYFFCVSNLGHYHFNPDSSVPFKVRMHPIVVGEHIRLEDYYDKYEVTSADVSGGKFSSTGGLSKPHAYFLYPKHPKDAHKVQDMAMDLMIQCKKIIKAANHSNEVFSEVRVSESSFSGTTSLIRPGYPAVYLNTPTSKRERNIYRIAEPK